jgi:hypothetical protein
VVGTGEDSGADELSPLEERMFGVHQAGTVAVAVGVAVAPAEGVAHGLVQVGAGAGVRQGVGVADAVGEGVAVAVGVGVADAVGDAQTVTGPAARCHSSSPARHWCGSGALNSK